MTRPVRVAAAFGALVLLCSAPPAAWATAAPTAPQQQSSTCGAPRWVGSWAAAPSDAGLTGGQTVARPLAAQTVRMVIRPSLSGTTTRVRLSNRYSDTAAELGPVSVALRDSGASAVAGTVRPVTFGGRPGVTLPAGQDVVSDPVQLPVTAGEDVLVSIAVPGSITTPTEHFTTRQTNYLTPNGTGDRTLDEDGAAFALTTATLFSNGWYFLQGLDVMAPPATGAVVAFGDSITDGFQGGSPGGSLQENPSGIDENVRYPDLLAARLRAAGRTAGVLNAGVSGNRVLSDAEPPFPFADAAVTRFRLDALAQPGVTDVIILEGINDLGRDADLTSEQLIAGLQQLVAQARASKLRVHLGTLTPAGGASQEYGTANTEKRRQAVNAWIRTRSGADSVIDFDKALRDPADPTRLLPEYDSSDHLHPSSAGYAAMAKAIDLKTLALRGCAASVSRPTPSSGIGGQSGPAAQGPSRPASAVPSSAQLPATGASAAVPVGAAALVLAAGALRRRTRR